MIERADHEDHGRNAGRPDHIQNSASLQVGRIFLSIGMPSGWLVTGRRKMDSIKARVAGK
jgi:hypothetical protein